MKKTMGEKLDDMGESIDEASITALVKTTLLYHRSTSALNTTVDTKEGVVNNMTVEGIKSKVLTVFVLELVSGCATMPQTWPDYERSAGIYRSCT